MFQLKYNQHVRCKIHRYSHIVLKKRPLSLLALPPSLYILCLLSSDSFQVLFRLNFLVVVLCIVMDRPYQFYYFVPLVTVWFMIIYATLAVWPQIVQKKANGKVFFSPSAMKHLYVTANDNHTENSIVSTSQSLFNIVKIC